MIKHNDSRHSCDDDPIIDYETGEMPTKDVPSYKELMSWWKMNIGNKFMNLPKQYRAIKTMRSNGYSDEQIKERALQMKGQTFFQEHGFDFMSVLSDFSKKITSNASQSITIR